MKILKQIPLLILCVIIGFPMKGQITGTANPQNGIIHCLTAELDEYKRKQNPGLGTIDEFEAWLQETMARTPQYLSREILTIPVIIHIVHDGEAVGSGTNISYEQILSQIEVLNEDFRRMEGTNGFNSDSAGADVEIEFCLANIDQSGKLIAGEPGVNRIDRNEMDWRASPYGIGYIDDVIQPASIWDPNKYFNIWVIPLDQQLLGFANSPVQSTLPDLFGTATATTDGVVINYQNFGRVGNLRPTFNLGRTLTHEVGHWLGLHHIWGPGSESSTCEIDDFCGDTPTTDESHYGCESGSFSCDSDDMVENYMEYSDDECMNIFTQCQRERMRTVMLNAPRRKELLTSDVCSVPTVAPTASFSYGDTVSCDGRVRFVDESVDLPTSWFWIFGNGETSEDRNPTTQYDSTGSYDVTLVVTNPLGANTITQTLHIVVESPGVSAGEDISPCQGEEVQLNAGSEDTTAFYLWLPTTNLDDPFSSTPILTAERPNTYILTVSFENGCTVTDTLHVDVAPIPTTFALPQGSITIPRGNETQLNVIGAETYIWTPSVGLSDPNIPNPVASPDSTTLYTVTGFNALGCAKEDSILVIVEGGVPIDPFLPAEQIFLPYPNPANTSVTFSAAFRETGKLSLELYDLRGRKIEKIFDQIVGQIDWNYEWQRSTLIPSGTYFVTWEMNGARMVQKIVLD